MFGFPGCCFTSMLLFGIVSRPWSPLSSLPPEVEVPLPLLLGGVPVLSGLAFCELAAGSPVTAPCPDGLPWAYDPVLTRVTQVAKTIGDILMVIPLG